jgi:hypothetical protein
VKLPKCSGLQYWTECGYEYDCDASSDVESCEYCLCQYHRFGGLYNPENGKRISKFIAFLLYGKRKLPITPSGKE